MFTSVVLAEVSDNSVCQPLIEKLTWILFLYDRVQKYTMLLKFTFIFSGCTAMTQRLGQKT